MRKAIPFLAPGLIIAAVALGCNSARAQNCPGNPDARVSGTSRYFLNCAHAKEETLRAWERRVSLEDGDFGRRGIGLPVSLPVSRSE